MTTDLTADLRAKAEAATPGPWTFGALMDITTDGSMVPGNLGGVFKHPGNLTIAERCWDGDALYIAAANPANILALLDAHKAEVEVLANDVDTAMKEARNQVTKRLANLRKYGWHLNDCERLLPKLGEDGFDDVPCTCGFSKAIGKT